MALKDVQLPFDPNSEEEVRFALASYFADLGFTLNEMSFEDSFHLRLGHSAIVINKDRQRRNIYGRSDLLLVRGGQPLAIVEAKAVDIDLSDADRDQGLSYARLLRMMAPFTVVTNGREIKIYDTVTAEELRSGTPADATWVKSGMRFVGVSGELRDWAIRTLFSLNFDTLRKYCHEQTARGLSDLHSTPDERRRYDPDLYVSRGLLRDKFRTFDESNSLCFAVIGESGTGKSNELCALAEMISNNHTCIALFYRASQLWNGLSNSIASDFVWEFQREEPVARIINRFSEVVRSHEAKLYIFIDGFDEFPGDLRTFRAELNEFVQHLDPDLVRLCASCKLNDWSFFVRDRGVTLNSLGQCVFPPPSTDTKMPGFILQSFSDKELDEAWIKYSKAFHITGNLLGETRQECHTPLMLRLISETYEHTNNDVPADISNVAVFNHYWSRKLADFNHQERLIAENIVAKAAEEMVLTNQSELDERDFLRELDSAIASSTVYENVTRFGLLVRRIHTNDVSYVTFPFEKLRSFVYTVKSRNWAILNDSVRQSEEVRRALNTRFGRDALFFYLDVVSENIEGWLAPILEFNLSLFIQAVRSLAEINRERGKSGDKIGDQTVVARSSNLARFILTYALLRNQFPNLKTRLLPCTSGEAGLWITNTFHGYRTLTSEYPQPIVQVSNEIVGQLWSGHMGKASQRELRLAGDVSNILWTKLSRSLPEAVALTELNKQLAKLVGAWLLDETTCPSLLLERIHSILKDHPGSWQGTPNGHNWQFLGYSSLEEAQNAECNEMIQRVEHLIKDWSKSYRDLAKTAHRWYKLQIEKMIILEWYLDQAKQSLKQLRPPMFTSQALFSYLRDGNFDRTIELVTQIAPEVIGNYSHLIERNFTTLATQFATYSHLKSRLIVEISEQSATFFKTDFLLLTYILLPSAPAGPPIVRLVSRDESIAERFIVHIRSAESLFADDVSLTTKVDDVIFTEPHAIVTRTRYPDHCVVSSQVYQLVHNEADHIFGDRFEWTKSSFTEVTRRKEIIELLRRNYS